MWNGTIGSITAFKCTVKWDFLGFGLVTNPKITIITIDDEAIMKHFKKMQSEFELCTRQLTQYHNEGFTCEADKQLAPCAAEIKRVCRKTDDQRLSSGTPWLIKYLLPFTPWDDLSIFFAFLLGFTNSSLCYFQIIDFKQTLTNSSGRKHEDVAWILRIVAYLHFSKF